MLVTPPASTSLLPATPSPVRTRARSDLDFFELCLGEDHNKTTPGTKFEISTADLQRQFLEASPEIRRRCKVLALEDSERFHRNSAPERIWQKATEADTMNSNPTLKSEAEASEAAEGGRAASAETIDENSTKAMSPAAALPAHVAAGTKAVAISKSSSSPKQCDNKSAEFEMKFLEKYWSDL
ncbi:hypothetical protein PsorP6_014046 [Peronosclerospora sorghi]|uniref:Uncharacterized protein n=1 Tax=Peronosclerospora sorghi TaxID=230839 RepID=A0ACC0VGP6_9STRA|nr:hypothetical protein PsorP6_014046 [Peronosclerospora sorghi]